MIDWEKSAELNGCTVEWLKARFEKYPKSAKKVVRVCDNCPNIQEVFFYQYTDLCHKCSNTTNESRIARSISANKRWSDIDERNAQSKRKVDYYKNNPESIAAASVRWSEYWSDQKHRDDQSVRISDYFKNNPEACDEVSKKSIDYWLDPKHRNEMSEIMVRYNKNHPEKGMEHSIWMKQYFIDNPDIGTDRNKNQVGGYDIVGHHIIYDYSDLTKNIIPMTRSMHMKLHQLFRKYGIIIPHINVKEII